MPIDFGLLSKAALTGLSDEEQNNLQRQATTQFLLGSLLSNDPATGYKAAQGVPEQYTSAQKSILEAQQKAADNQQKATDRQSISDFQAKYLPNQFNEASPQFRGPVTPDVEARQGEIVAAQAEGRPIFNIQNALQDLIRLPGAAQGPMRETITALQPKVQGNLLLNPNQQIIGGLPSINTEKGLVTTPTVQGGNVNFGITPASGFRDATALNSLPERSKGEDFVFDANQRVIGIRNAEGAIRALTERTSAETAAREANTPRPIINPDGSPGFTFVTPPAMRNQPNTGGTVAPQQGSAVTGTGNVGATGPTTAQAALNASYEPILKDAYAGYKVANSRSATLQQLRNAFNNPNFDTNAFTPAKTAISSFLNASGVTGDATKQYLTNAASARQGLNTLAAQSVSELPGAISNFELNFAQGRFGVITDPKESNRYAIDLMEVADQRKKDFYNFVSNPKNAGPDVIQKWQNSPQGTESLFVDPKLRSYLVKEEVKSGQYKGQLKYTLPDGRKVIFP